MRALALRDLLYAPHLQSRACLAFCSDGDRTHHPWERMQRLQRMHRVCKLVTAPTLQLIATDPGA